MSKLNPQIYVACLAAYNNGLLHGEWIDANQSVEELNETIYSMLAKSPIPQAEEWAIHAYEDFGEMAIDENESLKMVSALAAFVVENGELGGALLNHYGNDLEAATEALEDYYHGEHESEKDFAEQLTNDIDNVPSHLAFYIDYERMADDLFINDYFSLEVGGSVHVFSHH